MFTLISIGDAIEEISQLCKKFYKTTFLTSFPFLSFPIATNQQNLQKVSLANFPLDSPQNFQSISSPSKLFSLESPTNQQSIPTHSKLSFRIRHKPINFSKYSYPSKLSFRIATDQRCIPSLVSFPLQSHHRPTVYSQPSKLSFTIATTKSHAQKNEKNDRKQVVGSVTANKQTPSLFFLFSRKKEKILSKRKNQVILKTDFLRISLRFFYKFFTNF